ncbi:MAG: carbonic anhydrase [Chlamydiales bacterium]|nr:carbonic anhydrase [Chlamydiales bacterium]
MRIILIGLVSFGLFAQTPLEQLMEGNKRYVQDSLEHPNRTAESRQALTASQEPFAIIVSCADSRVAPEIIFDQGIGDLFVVRVAGNVIGPIELQSINYSALHLHSSIILVLGHENCGAVDAVIKDTTETIPTIAKLIEPAVQKVEKERSRPLLEAAIKTNAINMKNTLLKTKAIANLVSKGSLKVYAGYYDMHTGAVSILD